MLNSTRIITLALGLLLLGMLGSCSGSPSAPIASTAPAASSASVEGSPVVSGVSPIPSSVVASVDESMKQQACLDLDSVLYQLTQASDPAQMEKDLGMVADERGVQVMITLDGDDATVLEQYGAVVTGRSGNTLQAFVPIDQLCALADAPQVLAVRFQPVTLP